MLGGKNKGPCFMIFSCLSSLCISRAYARVLCVLEGTLCVYPQSKLCNHEHGQRRWPERSICRTTDQTPLKGA